MTPELGLAVRFDPALAITLKQVYGGSGGESVIDIFARLHDAPRCLEDSCSDGIWQRGRGFFIVVRPQIFLRKRKIDRIHMGRIIDGATTLIDEHAARSSLLNATHFCRFLNARLERQSAWADFGAQSAARLEIVDSRKIEEERLAGGGIVLHPVDEGSP